MGHPFLSCGQGQGLPQAERQLAKEFKTRSTQPGLQFGFQTLVCSFSLVPRVFLEDPFCARLSTGLLVFKEKRYRILHEGTQLFFLNLVINKNAPEKLYSDSWVPLTLHIPRSPSNLMSVYDFPKKTTFHIII